VKDIRSILIYFLALSHFIEIQDSKINIKLLIYNFDIYKFFVTHFKKLFSDNISVSSFKKKIFKNEIRVFEITIRDSEKLLNEINDIKILNDNIFWLSLFLNSGNINSPYSSNYLLSLGVSKKYIYDQIEKFLSISNYFQFKIRTQNKKYIFYIQKSESIADFLKYIGSSELLLHFEDKRIERDFLNNIQRLNNLDLSNIRKTAKESSKIQRLFNQAKKEGLLTQKFTHEEINIIKLKINNLEHSHSQIADKYNENFKATITKAKVSYIFRKLKNLRFKKN